MTVAPSALSILLMWLIVFSNSFFKVLAGMNTAYWSFAHSGIGVLLLVASAFKIDQAFHEGSPPVGLLQSPVVWGPVVAVELLLGAILLAQICPKKASRSAQVIFTIFLMATLYEGFVGTRICGCFGRMSMSPFWMSLVDAAVVVVLVATHRGIPDVRGAGTSMWTLVGPVGGGLLALAILIPFRETVAVLPTSGVVPERVTSVILQPPDWIGKRLPILDRINVRDQLHHGQWIVVLFRHDCSECRLSIPRFARLASSLSTDAEAAKFALVELPPYAPPDDTLLESAAPCLLGRLDSSVEWIVKTPLTLLVRDGLVENCFQEGEFDLPD